MMNARKIPLLLLAVLALASCESTKGLPPDKVETAPTLKTECRKPAPPKDDSFGEIIKSWLAATAALMDCSSKHNNLVKAIDGK